MKEKGGDNVFDLDRLSYRAYGNLVIVVLLVIALLLNLFPFSLIEFGMCVIQIPIYLFVRCHLGKPLHANGLNICFFLTVLFYILLFISIKVIYFLLGANFTIIFSTLLTTLSCYVTSTVPNEMQEKDKLFFGYKKHDDSKYNRLIDYIKFNGLDENLIDAEERLKKVDSQLYLIYKRKFREDKTFKEISEEFDLDNPRIVESLDKAYYYIIGALRI